MEKKLLFIGQTSSFLVKSIVNELTNTSFKCFTCEYNMHELPVYMKSATGFFIYAEAEISTVYSMVINSLKEHCNQENKKVFVMGDPEYVNTTTKMLGESIVWEQFLRPINTKTVSEKIISLYEGTENETEKKHILVVDDSGTFLHTIKSWLEPKYTVTMVNSALNGLSFLGRKTPDLILLDYEMPVCSGPQMLEMLRGDENFKNIPVIFLTGKGDRESINKVLALKPQGYLLKSLPQDSIVKMIDDYFKK